MQNPSCGLRLIGTRFEGNVAHSEGGAMAISDLTARKLYLKGCMFSANRVRYDPMPVIHIPRCLDGLLIIASLCLVRSWVLMKLLLRVP
jgi:hypothetical protein